MTYTIEKLNQMDPDEFCQVLGNVVEHCSLIAASIWVRRPFRDLKHLHEDFCRFIDELPPLAHEGILRSHPDLAGRLAAQGLLTTESTKEQLAAGLDTMTPEERSILTKNNNEYKTKFGFPFVICARENKKNAILEGISMRVNNSAVAELQKGIEEVKKIAYYRLDAIVES